jgi:hypothetical protein
MPRPATLLRGHHPGAPRRVAAPAPSEVAIGTARYQPLGRLPRRPLRLPCGHVRGRSLSSGHRYVSYSKDGAITAVQRLQKGTQEPSPPEGTATTRACSNKESQQAAHRCLNVYLGFLHRPRPALTYSSAVTLKDVAAAATRRQPVTDRRSVDAELEFVPFSVRCRRMCPTAP